MKPSFIKFRVSLGTSLRGAQKIKRHPWKSAFHVIFDEGERLHCASPLRRSLRGRPPGGSGTWPPWWRWTSRPSPGNNSQHAASVPLMSGWKARCHSPSIHSVCQVAFFSDTICACTQWCAVQMLQCCRYLRVTAMLNEPNEPALAVALIGQQRGRWRRVWRVWGVLFCSLNGN